MKQKEDLIKGDWIELLLKDFAFIGIDMNEDEIRSHLKVNTVLPAGSV